MRKIFKKVITAVASMAMVAGMLASLPTIEAKADSKVVNVHVNGDGVSVLKGDGTKLNLHMWGGYETSWPGVELTQSGSEWVYSNITVSSNLNLIVNGNGGQTPNLENITVDKKDIYVTVAADKTASVSYGSEAAPSVDPDAGKQKKDIEVYVKLDGITMDTVNLYTFDTGLSGNAGWPGEALVDDNGIYKGTAHVEASVTEFSAIINNGGDKQTADIKNISTSTGKVYITVDSALKTVVNTNGFDQGSNTGHEETGAYEKPTTTPAPTTPAPTTTEAFTAKDVTVKVKLDGAVNWEKVYVYSWNADGNNGAWPGVEATKDGDYYVITVNAKTKYMNMIANNGSGEQTIDIENIDCTNNEIIINVSGEKNADGKLVATSSAQKTTSSGDSTPYVALVALVAALGCAFVALNSKKARR